MYISTYVHTYRDEWVDLLGRSMYTYICIYIHTSIYTYIHIYIYRYIDIYIDIYI
jgi:hypothetical protein